MVIKFLSILKFLILAMVLYTGQLLSAGQNGIESSLQNVEKLIEQSSASRQITTSNSSAAIKVKRQARELYQQAVKSYQIGNAELASQLLQQASRKMFEAVRMVKVDEGLIEKHKRDYKNQLSSINALVGAYDRIAVEKGIEKSAQGAIRDLVDEKLSAAEVLRASGEHEEGRKVLYEAYVAAKVAIEQLRGGDTLVRALEFKSKDEEYTYELDRYATHKMLIDVLVREKIKSNDAIKKMVQKFLEKAAQLKQESEKQASSGDHDSAVSTIERATKEIVRAIRSAGIYIPG